MGKETVEISIFNGVEVGKLEGPKPEKNIWYELPDKGKFRMMKTMHMRGHLTKEIAECAELDLSLTKKYLEARIHFDLIKIRHKFLQELEGKNVAKSKAKQPKKPKKRIKKPDDDTIFYIGTLPKTDQSGYAI